MVQWPHSKKVTGVDPWVWGLSVWSLHVLAVYVGSLQVRNEMPQHYTSYCFVVKVLMCFALWHPLERNAVHSLVL